MDALFYNVHHTRVEYVPMDYRLLMAGEYSTWDLYQSRDDDVLHWNKVREGVEPPMGYKEGSE